jgi:DNA-binding LacI/PurR family transcriptional regulator
VGVQVLDWRKQRYLALVLPEFVVTPRPLMYFLQFSTTLQTKLQHLGWDTSLFMMLEDENAAKGVGELVRALEGHRVLAVVSCCGDVLPPKIRKLAETAEVPVWTVDEDSRYFPSVDYGAMIQAGVQELVKGGAHRIAALFSGPPPGAESSGDSLAVKRFCAELEARGLVVEPEWIIDHSAARLPGSGWQGFRDLWSAKAGHPDGLLVLDDVLYHDAAQAIYELGIRVPSDLQIVTHSNSGDSYEHPFPVTRLEINPEEIAGLFAATLNDLLEGREPQPKRATFRVIPAPKERALPALQRVLPRV